MDGTSIRSSLLLSQAYSLVVIFFFFFFNDTATTEIYTLSLHDALPIYRSGRHRRDHRNSCLATCDPGPQRSEEHTSELQSQSNLVCRLLLEKKKKNNSFTITTIFYPHNSL